MQFHRSLEGLQLPDAWLTLGSYDGVHLGHQAIIRNLVAGAHAAGLPAVVVTFDPHPIQILRPDIRINMLTSVEERAALLGSLGVDHVLAHPFNQEVSQLSAELFLQNLKRYIGFSRLLVGYDFAMGKDRDGSTDQLAEYGQKLGYEIEVFDPVQEGDDVFSSSRIRRFIADGKVGEAAKMLGRHYSVTGKVVTGSQRGRTIGIPTANINVARGRAIPETGVYACKITLGDKVYAAATNIGVRPTFEEDAADETIEAHILDFDQNIYNEVIQVSFVERLRGEKKFEGIDALIAQIQADIVRTREVFRETVS